MCTITNPNPSPFSQGYTTIARYLRDEAARASGVVDSRLNVYGIRGLKVADLSIGPGNVSANTYSTAPVIREKAAVIIAEELGIKGVIVRRCA